MNRFHVYIKELKKEEKKNMFVRLFLAGDIVVTRNIRTPTVLPAKSDSDVVFCLQ